jgi:hypothetical protein
MTKREAGAEMMMWLLEQSLALAKVFIEGSKIFGFIFLFDHTA